MRWLLLLLPLFVLGLIQFPYGIDEEEVQGPKVIVGPLLTPPNPDVYSQMPFILQPTGQKVSVDPAAAQEDLAVVLIEFPDESAGQTPQYFDNLLFDQTSGARTLNNFYLESSYGKTEIGGQVTSQWYSSVRNMTWYGRDGSGIDDANGPIYCLAVEAVLRANADVDFSQFDRNGDGEVDHLVIIHAGEGQENSPVTSLIWSHRWAIIDATNCGYSTRRLNVDGVDVYGYFMTSESSPMGVFAHELGHDFGLPDLYDTTGITLGIGVWGVMGTGSWNGVPRGTQPAHFAAWSKAKLGWLDLTVVTAPLLPASIQAVELFPDALRLPVKSSRWGDEYFVVENRQPIGFDVALPGSGLLIWHIDETRMNNDASSRRLVDLEEADDDLGFLYTDKPNQASDAWRDDEVGFTPLSTPNSNDNSGARTGWKVANIGPSAPVMTANISKGVAVDVSILDIVKRDFVPVNQTTGIDVRVINKGLAEVSNGSLTLDIYHEAYETGSRVLNQVRSLPAMAEGTVTVQSFTFAPSQEGRYLIEASVDILGDEVPEDNYRIVHLLAGNFLLLHDVEGSVSTWGRPTNSDSAYRWEVVDDGDGYGSAHSPTRAWRFGYFGGGGTTYRYHYLESPVIPLDGKVPRLVFYQRYQLTTRTEGVALQPLESDVATVETSFDGGPWTRVANFTGTQLSWKRAYVDLAPYTNGTGVLRLRFNATASVMPDDGGWWIDDVVVLTQPLKSAALVKSLESQKEVVPGGTVSFLFILVNIGDLDEEFHFKVDGLPTDWEAFIGVNETSAVPVEEYRLSLEVDQQIFLTLIVRSPLLAERGVLLQGILQALSPDENVGASFIFTVEVPVGFGFNLSGRTLIVVFIIGGVMLAIAVVLTALKRR